MDKKPRLRGPNFTTSDNLLLCDIISKHKYIIENKKTDGATLLQKQQVWAEVALEYNSSTTGHYRTVESLLQNYKNLKKKAKKNSSSPNMTVPGGGPPPTTTKNDIIDNVKLVGPAMDGMYTIYDGDSGLVAIRDIVPIEIKNMEIEKPSPGLSQEDSKNKTHLKRKYESSPGTSQEDNVHLIVDTPFSDYFTNDRANLKKKPSSLLTCKQKLIYQKQTVANKFKALASEKMELVQLQKELLRVQLQEEIEKADHNRQIRAIQLEELKRVHEHNKILREMELKTFNN